MQYSPANGFERNKIQNVKNKTGKPMSVTQFKCVCVYVYGDYEP